MTLEQLTIQLQSECEQCLARYNDMRALNKSADFFTEVKPHVDFYTPILTDWQQQALAWQQKTKPKNFHPQQITVVGDAFTQILVQSFHKETSKKRFNDTVQLVRFTLQSLMRNLTEQAHANS